MIIQDDVKAIDTVVDQGLLEENINPNRGTAVLVGALLAMGA